MFCGRGLERPGGLRSGVDPILKICRRLFYPEDRNAIEQLIHLMRTTLCYAMTHGAMHALGGAGYLDSKLADAVRTTQALRDSMIVPRMQKFGENPEWSLQRWRTRL